MVKLRILILLVVLSTCTTLPARKVGYTARFVKVGVVCDSPQLQLPDEFFYKLNVVLPSLDSLLFTRDKRLSRRKCLEAAAYLTRYGSGKQVLDALLDKTPGGKPDMTSLYQKALENATYDDVMEARQDAGAATADVLKKELSRMVMKTNYIVYVEGASWVVFKVVVTDRIIDQVFFNWERPAYDLIQVPVEYVAHGTRRRTLAQSISRMLSENVSENFSDDLSDTGHMLLDMGKKAPAFALRASLRSRHPFYVNMGDTQGIKSGDMVSIYRSHIDRKGRLFSKKVCSARATDVYDNTSRLYSVSGKFASMKKGDVAVWRGRRNNALSIMGQYSFGGNDPGYGIRLQYERRIGKFTRRGMAHYLLAGIEAGRYGREPAGVWWPGDYDTSLNPDPREVAGRSIRPVLVNAGVNVGYAPGFSLLGRIELMPYVLTGIQVSVITRKLTWWEYEAPSMYASVPSGWKNADGVVAFFLTGHAGLRMNVNVRYPLQLTCGADYSYHYMLRGISTKAATRAHELNRLQFYAGLRYIF